MKIRPETDCTSPKLFNLELIASRMRGRRLIFGTFRGKAASGGRTSEGWLSLSGLMISEAYRLACRTSFLRIRQDLCKFVLSATCLVTSRGESVAISPLLIFTSGSECFGLIDCFFLEYFTLGFGRFIEYSNKDIKMCGSLARLFGLK